LAIVQWRSKSGEDLPIDDQQQCGMSVGSGRTKSVMKKNVGSSDAAVRFLLGWVLLFMGIHGFGWWSLFGLWPLLTMALGFCPLYVLFHIDTAAWEEGYDARHHKHSPQ
jgi:hypothetical protein